MATTKCLKQLQVHQQGPKIAAAAMTITKTMSDTNYL